jgi:hypothetical protein
VQKVPGSHLPHEEHFATFGRRDVVHPLSGNLPAPLGQGPPGRRLLLGGELMRGGGLATRTTLVNLANRRAASLGEREGDSSSDSVVVPAKGAEGALGTDNTGGSAVRWGVVVGLPDET